MTKPQIKNPAREMAADRVGIAFGETPFSIARLRNLATGGTFCAHGEQAFLIRVPSRVSDPVFITRIESTDEIEDGLQLKACDETGLFRVILDMTATAEGLRFDVEVTAPEPIWMVEWTLSGLELSDIVIPALGGQTLDRRMPAGTTLSYKYPFWWNAQFVIGEMARGGVWFRTKDVDPRFKLARIKRTARGFNLSYGFEANAPLASRTLKGTWYLDCYKGTWKVPVEIHRTWLEKNFGLVDINRRPGFPEWAREINFVLEMWGIGKESPEPLHTFQEMEARLRAWARLHPPKNTLVYLPGFAEHGIDSRAPSYEPSKELGGAAGFRALVDAAHEMGYKVLIHTNALCMTFDHPLFERFKEHQVVDTFGRTQGWGLDIDGDWLAEPYFAYINPGVGEWGDLMTSVIRDLIDRFGIDGVFLDQTLLAFNVSRGPDFVSGMANHIRRLAGEFPDVLFAGEGLHEQVVQPLPMAQIHGIDSIAEVHALDGGVRWRKVHPVSTHLFGKYTRYTAHLLTRHPSHPMFRMQETAYAMLKVIPALCLYNNTQAMASPAVRAMIRRARGLKIRKLPFHLRRTER
jgi:hypothetical protein